MGQATEIISKYDVLFAIRTGVTVLLPKTPAFDCGIEIPVRFKISPENPRDIVITAAEKSAILKDMRKEHLDAAISRGVLMLYEMTGDEVVRCTPCNYQAG